MFTGEMRLYYGECNNNEYRNILTEQVHMTHWFD